MKKSKRSKKRKLFSAIALGMILIGGSAVAIPVADSSLLPHADTFKMIKNNPEDFLKTNNLPLSKNFDFFKEMNKEFTNKTFNSTNGSGFYKFNEKKLAEGIKRGDYKKWRNAVAGNDLNSSSISEEDFNVLVKIHREREKFEEKL